MSLEIKNLAVYYDKDKQKAPQCIFQNFNLTASPGDIVGIFGNSGTGKSSLLNAISGFFLRIDLRDRFRYAPLSSPILGYFGGAIHSSVNRYQFIPQDRLIFEYATIEENIRIGARSDQSLEKERIRTILKQLGLEYEIDRVAYRLSGGEKQRVAIARTLVSSDQSIYLLDEPCNGIDYILVNDMVLPLVKKHIQKTESVCMYVSHNPNELIKVANKYVVFKKLSNGTIEFYLKNSLEEFQKAIDKIRGLD